MEQEKQTLLAKYKRQQQILTLLPLAALAVLFGTLCAVVTGKGYRLDMYLRIIFNVMRALFWRWLPPARPSSIPWAPLISASARPPCSAPPWAS